MKYDGIPYPTGLKSESGVENSITLTWNMQSINFPAGLSLYRYHIYRNNEYIGYLSHYYGVTLRYVDTGVISGDTYNYYVTATYNEGVT